MALTQSSLLELFDVMRSADGGDEQCLKPVGRHREGRSFPVIE
jgi:hypothetical protein